MAFTIVVGYDGSDGARAALDEALGLARLLSGRLVVTYAYGDPRSYSGAHLGPTDTLAELSERLLAEARAVGEKLLAEALARGGGDVSIEPVLIEAGAAQGLLSVARQQREPVAAVRMRFEKDGTLGRIANHIQTEKTLSFLFEHARKTAE